MLSDNEWQTTMYGVENVCYTVENGEKEFVPDVYPSFGKSIVRRNTDTDFYMPNDCTLVEPDLIKSALTECMDNAVYSLDRGYTPSIATKPLFIDQQTNLIKTTTKILLGEEDVSAYDKALDKWYQNGGEEYVKEMNEYIDKVEK